MRHAWVRRHLCLLLCRRPHVLVQRRARPMPSVSLAPVAPACWRPGLSVDGLSRPLVLQPQDKNTRLQGLSRSDVYAEFWVLFAFVQRFCVRLSRVTIVSTNLGKLTGCLSCELYYICDVSHRRTRVKWCLNTPPSENLCRVIGHYWVWVGFKSSCWFI